MREKIQKVCEELDFQFPSEENLAFEFLTQQLEMEGIINFSVVYRENSSGNDSWLQCEYWSNKLGKTIIFEYDYSYEFESLNDLVNTLQETQSQIDLFESRIILKPYDK